jgi:hypothetical protein
LAKPSWTISICLKGNEGQEGKTGLFLGVGTSGNGNKEKGNEGEYGGCILYPYVKIEE